MMHTETPTVERTDMPRFRVTGRFVLIALICFFGTVFGVNFVFVRLALSTLPGTVVDSPYRSSQAFNGELAAARAQVARGWQLTSRVLRDPSGTTRISLDVRGAKAADLAGAQTSVLLMRPTHVADDRRAALTQTGTGRFEGVAEHVAPGAFDLVIEMRKADQRLFRSVERVVLP